MDESRHWFDVEIAQISRLALFWTDLPLLPPQFFRVSTARSLLFQQT
jgi:hypothetical protein